jgi:hypothetical protein
LFILAPQILDLSLAPAGTTAVMVVFQINQTSRLTTTKVFSPCPGYVLGKASLRIDGYSGIKRIIRTEDDIDLPVHRPVLLCVCHNIFSISLP